MEYLAIVSLLLFIYCIVKSILPYNTSKYDWMLFSIVVICLIISIINKI